LSSIDRELDAHEYRTHEFGDSVFIERAEQSQVLIFGLFRRQQPDYRQRGRG
jgi:hypothetical protein